MNVINSSSKCFHFGVYMIMICYWMAMFRDTHSWGQSSTLLNSHISTCSMKMSIWLKSALAQTGCFIEFYSPLLIHTTQPLRKQNPPSKEPKEPKWRERGCKGQNVHLSQLCENFPHFGLYLRLNCTSLKMSGSTCSPFLLRPLFPLSPPFFLSFPPQSRVLSE